MAESENIDNLTAVRTLLKTSLEKSTALASALNKTAPRLKEINQQLPSLEAAIRQFSLQNCGFTAIGDQIDRAIGPATAVLNIFRTVHDLENSIYSNPSSDLSAYLTAMKRLEDALKFLTDNCRLAILWFKAVIEFIEDNAVSNDLCILINVKKSLRILRDLQATEERAYLDGGILSTAYHKLEIEFKRLLTENSVHLASLHSPKAVAIIQKLQGIVERLKANNRLKNCVSMYVEIRSLNARRRLQALGLDYLTEIYDLHSAEEYIDPWGKHFKLAVKHLELEYKLCNEVFRNLESDFWACCFAKITVQSGFIVFLQFGKKMTESKKNSVNLLKLLDTFAVLNNLRLDFSRLFGSQACIEIQTQMRDLIRRVVDGACEIFWELPVQDELLQWQSYPPLDGSIPKLVVYVTDYCNLLLGEHYRLILTQVLKIHHSWKHETYQDEFLSNQIYSIIKTISLNIDAMSKSYSAPALSYLFMMNNHCHFHNLKGTKLGDMMGDPWLRAHEQCKDHYAALYLKESWGKLLGLLRQDGLILLSGDGTIAQDLAKERLQTFEEVFNDMYNKQSEWIVSDESLRERMCRVVVQAIVPLYKSYVQNYTVLVRGDAGGGGRKYMKLSEQNLESKLSSLFQPKITKCVSTRQNKLIGKIRNVLINHFGLTLTAM